jgi:hypothetical protein
MKAFFASAAILALAACTTNPGLNSAEGAIGGAAVGCGIGAAVTAPLLGIGCIPGAIWGGVGGATLGAASTVPPPNYAPAPPPGYYP